MAKLNRLALVNASILLLCTFSSVAIGFASWTISNSDSNTAKGIIATDNQRDNLQGVSIEYVSGFTLNTYQFDNQENNPSKIGTLVFRLSVDYSEVVEDIIDASGYANFKVSLSFGDGSINLFTSTYYQYAEIDSQSGASFVQDETVTGNYVSYIFKTNADYTNKYLSFSFKNTILRYREQLMSDSFYLRLEGVVQ